MLIFTLIATANTIFIGWVAFYVLDLPNHEPELRSGGYWANAPEYDYNPNEN